MSVPRVHLFTSTITGLALVLGACADQGSNPIAPQQTPAVAPSPFADVTTLSTTTVNWPFASLVPSPASDPVVLGPSYTFSQSPNGSITATSGANTYVTAKGFALPIGSPERGIGLCHRASGCDPIAEDEVGDGGPGTLDVNFDGVLPSGSILEYVVMSSLQPGEGYSYAISTDGGVTFGATTNVPNSLAGPYPGDANANATLDVNLPTAGLVIRFTKNPYGQPATDNDYVVMSATTSFTETETSGCTLTQGYWKNHTDNWPAGYDPNADFFGGDSWITVLQTPPKHGNAYYILAHQYIAAVLNGASGASTTPDVDAAISGAEAYFGGGSASRDQLIAWANTLDEYNNGLASGGPSHCGD